MQKYKITVESVIKENSKLMFNYRHILDYSIVNGMLYRRKLFMILRDNTINYLILLLFTVKNATI